MNGIRRILSSLVLVVFVLTSALPALAASEYEDVMAGAMRDALVKTGMQPRMASNVAQQNLFFGIVMLKDVQVQLLSNQQEKLLAQAERVGAALGTALGSAFKTYGGKKMQETPAVMMHAARAGLVPEAASETFAVLAQNGYAFDALKQIIHEASEVVRSEKLPDAGVNLCRDIRKIAAKKVPVQDLQREIVSVAKAEKARQLALLAKNEAERKKRDGGNGGGDRTAAGRQVGGAASSASRGNGGQAASGGASSSGASSGESSGGGAASGSTGGASSGSGASSSGGASSGGSSGSGGSGSSSGGNSSGGAGGSGASGGNSGGGGASGGGSDSSGGASGAGGNANGSGSAGSGSGGSSSGGGSDGAAE